MASGSNSLFSEKFVEVFRSVSSLDGQPDGKVMSVIAARSVTTPKFCKQRTP